MELLSRVLFIFFAVIVGSFIMWYTFKYATRTYPNDKDELILDLKVMKVISTIVFLFITFIVVMMILTTKKISLVSIILEIIVLIILLFAFGNKITYARGHITKQTLFFFKTKRKISDIKFVVNDYWKNTVLEFNDGKKMHIEKEYAGYYMLLAVLVSELPDYKFYFYRGDSENPYAKPAIFKTDKYSFILPPFWKLERPVNGEVEEKNTAHGGLIFSNSLRNDGIIYIVAYTLNKKRSSNYAKAFHESVQKHISPFINDYNEGLITAYRTIRYRKHNQYYKEFSGISAPSSDSKRYHRIVFVATEDIFISIGFFCDLKEKKIQTDDVQHIIDSFRILN